MVENKTALLSLVKLTAVAREVIEANGRGFEVIGTIPSKGHRSYVEVIVAGGLSGTPDGGRRAIGLFRGEPEDRIRAQLLATMGSES
jgi:hypothetical protein